MVRLRGLLFGCVVFLWGVEGLSAVGRGMFFVALGLAAEVRLEFFLPSG